MTPWTTARQAPLSVGFPRQALWSGLPLDSQAIPQCLCRPQDRVHMPQFAFAGPRRLGLPGLRHSDLPGLRQAPRSPPTSLPQPGCPCCTYPVCSSKCGHTSLHTPEPSLAPPPTIRPLSPLLAPRRCEVCLHTPLPHRPWVGGECPSRSPPPAACRPGLAHELLLFGLDEIGLHRVLNFHEWPTFSNHDFT